MLRTQASSLYPSLLLSNVGSYAEAHSHLALGRHALEKREDLRILDDFGGPGLAHHKDIRFGEDLQVSEGCGQKFLDGQKRVGLGAHEHEGTFVRASGISSHIQQSALEPFGYVGFRDQPATPISEPTTLAAARIVSRTEIRHVAEGAARAPQTTQPGLERVDGARHVSLGEFRVGRRAVHLAPEPCRLLVKHDAETLWEVFRAIVIRGQGSHSV